MQEEASKLSKRAKRRAAGEEEPNATAEGDAPEQGAGAEDEPVGEGDAASEEAAPGAPNRQARRTAAAQARARRKREREAASAIGLDAGEMVDDALVRFTDKVSRLARKNWNIIQWAIGLGILGYVGFQVYSWRRAKVTADVSDTLYEAVLIEQGTVGDPSEQGKPDENGIIDPTPIFASDEARLQAAAERYAAAAGEKQHLPAAAFARVGQAGVLLEQGKADEALAAYDQAATMEGAKESPELQGAALLGRGLSLEAKGDLPGALAAFEQLAKLPSFEARALFQKARLEQLQGNVEASKALLNELFKKLGPPQAASFGGLPQRPDFLRQRATALASIVDPLEKDVQVPKPPLGADAVQQMLEQLKEQGVVTPPAPSP